MVVTEIREHRTGRKQSAQPEESDLPRSARSIREHQSTTREELTMPVRQWSQVEEMLPALGFSERQCGRIPTTNTPRRCPTINHRRSQKPQPNRRLVGIASHDLLTIGCPRWMPMIRAMCCDYIQNTYDRLSTLDANAGRARCCSNPAVSVTRASAAGLGDGIPSVTGGSAATPSNRPRKLLRCRGGNLFRSTSKAMRPGEKRRNRNHKTN